MAIDNRELLLSKIILYAKNDDNVLSVYQNGSLVDDQALHDQFSDLDIVYIVKKEVKYNQLFFEQFGPVLIMQNNHPIYLVQFTDTTRVDLTIIAQDNIASFTDVPRKLLLDKGCSTILEDVSINQDYHITVPTKATYEAVVNEFWWVSLYVLKGLIRDEATYAMHIMNACQRPCLHQMLSWFIGITKGFNVTTGKYDRYFKSLLPNEYYDELLSTYPSGDKQVILSCLKRMNSFFTIVSKQIAKAYSFDFNQKQIIEIEKYISINSMYIKM